MRLYFITDVVRAYKSLQKERDALQTGLSALSAVGTNTAATPTVPSSKTLRTTSTKTNVEQNVKRLEYVHSDNIDCFPSSASSSSLASSTQCDNQSETSAFEQEISLEPTEDIKCKQFPEFGDTAELNEETLQSTELKGVTASCVESEPEHIQNLQKQLKSVTIAMTGLTSEKENLKRSFMVERKKMADEKRKVLLH